MNQRIVRYRTISIWIPMTMSEAVNPYSKSLVSTPHMLACFGRRKPILAIRNLSFVPKRQPGWTFGGVLFPIPPLENFFYLVCTIRAHDCISTKSRGFVSKKSNLAPATSESEQKSSSQKTVAAMNHGNLCIPPLCLPSCVTY